MTRRLPSLVTVGALLVAGAVTGCGSTPVADLPPPAGVPSGPTRTPVPDGRVLPRADASRALRALAVAADHARVALPSGVVATADARRGEVRLERGGRVIARRRLAGTPTAIARYDAGRRLAVVLGRSRRVVLLHVPDLATLGSTPVGVGPTGVACRDRGPCFVVDAVGGALLVVSPVRSDDPPRVVRRLDLQGGPYAIAVDEDRARIWVALPGRDQLAQLPGTARPRVLRRLSTLARPTGVAVDPADGRVVLTGRWAGRPALQVVDPSADGPPVSP